MIQNVSFLYEGTQPAGILLIHGLTGTPNEMRLVGKGLQRAGFTVYGMQLAGHCGDESDLLATNWHDWDRSVKEAAEKLAKQVDHFFVAGLSMGAILSLKLAADRPDLVAGVGVYGASFRYDGWSIPRTAQWLARLLPLAKPLRVGRNRVFMEQPPYGIRDERLRERITSSMFGGDSAAAGLRGNPWWSLADMYALSAHVRRRLREVRCPCLVVHAIEDDVASLWNVELVERNVSGRVEKVLLADSYHMVTVDRERDVLVKRTSQFFDDIVTRRTGATPGPSPSTHDTAARS